MTNQILLLSIYIVGFFLSYWMIKVEHEADGETYTNGTKVLQVVLSFLSLIFVVFLLIAAWVRSVHKYWNQPLDKKKPE